jgi:NTP pyrophosphatase (non-canonical NTP hydrolase)
MHAVTRQEKEERDALLADVVLSFQAGVEKFNLDVTALPVPAIPTLLNPNRAEWARTALLEEANEFREAIEKGDIVEAADALLDSVFFALGRLCEMGIPAKAVWGRILEANMAKQRGELSKRPGSLGHDAVKPEGWTPPDHSWLLTFSLADLAKARMFDELSPVFQEITKLRAAKGEDYNNVPGGRDAYFPFGHQSYAHMLNTKTLRVMSLVNAMGSGRVPNFESVRDSVRDLVNYGAFYAEWIDRQGEARVAA